MTKHFFDIGSNIGQSFDWLEGEAGGKYREHTVWCFEPSPRHYAKLIKQAKKHRVAYEIKLCPFGIGANSETIRFYEKDDPKGDSFESWLATDHEVTNIRQGYEVVASVVSLTEFIHRHTAHGDEIVLDIDAEGSEYGMLASLLHDKEALKRVTEIMVEFHHIRGAGRFVSKDVLTDAFKQLGKPLKIRGSV